MQLQHPHRRDAPGDGRGGDPGRVDRLADGRGAAAHLLRDEEKALRPCCPSTCMC